MHNSAKERTQGIPKEKGDTEEDLACTHARRLHYPWLLPATDLVPPSSGLSNSNEWFLFL